MLSFCGSRTVSSASSPQLSNVESPVANLSFSGCGFLGIYHVGVASCCKVYAPHLVEQQVSGASAGALVAAALICDCCLGECTTFTLNLALQARSRALGPLSPSFELVKNLRQALNKFLPDNAHQIASGRLHISLTRVSDRKNFLVSEFRDKNDLIDALICSSFVPLYSGILPPKYRGVRFVDGALTDNIPMLNESTITVSPFAGESDICPDDNSCNLHHISLAGTSIQLTAGNLYRMSVAFFPPTPEILSNMCRQGFDDALRYLKRNKLISCSHHLSIQSAIMSSSPIKFRIPGEDSSDASTEMDAESMDVEVNSTVGDDDSDSDCISDCDECDERERYALQDNPPVSVLTALQAACDAVNRGFFAQVYKTKAYRALSLMATPYVLPFELAYIFVKKFYDWAPYMSEDMQWFMKGLYVLVRDMLASAQSIADSSAAAADRGRILREWGFTWEMRWGLHLQTVSAAKQSSYIESSPAPKQLPLPTSSSSMNLNLGISVDYTAATSGLNKSPLHCASEARRQLLGSSEHQPASEGSSVTAAMSKSRRVSKPQRYSTTVSDVSCDSFEDCLQAAQHMDAALAYYYADEKAAGGIKVVEIFPLPRHSASSTTHDHTATSVARTRCSHEERSKAVVAEHVHWS